MDKKQLAEEEIKRALLLMKYDSKKTLTENVEETEEMNEYFAAAAPILRGAASLGGKLLSKIPWLRSAVTRMGGGTNVAKNVAIQGGIFGATEWIGNVITSGGDSFKKTKAFFDGCDALGKDLKPTLDASKHKASAEKIYDAIEGVGTKLPNVKVGLRDMPTVADICAMRKYYNETYGDLYNDLDGDIDGNDFTTYVWSAIEPQVTKAQSELSKVSPDPDNTGGTSGGGGGGGTSGGGGGGRGWRTDCSGTYSRGCKSEKVREVQACLGGLVADGLFGPKTEAAVKAKLGTTTFTDADVPKLCGKSEVKPEEDDFETLDGEDPNEL